MSALCLCLCLSYLFDIMLHMMIEMMRMPHNLPYVLKFVCTIWYFLLTLITASHVTLGMLWGQQHHIYMNGFYILTPVCLEVSLSSCGPKTLFVSLLKLSINITWVLFSVLPGGFSKFCNFLFELVLIAGFCLYSMKVQYIIIICLFYTPVNEWLTNII